MTATAAPSCPPCLHFVSKMLRVRLRTPIGVAALLNMLGKHPQIWSFVTRLARSFSSSCSKNVAASYCQVCPRASARQALHTTQPPWSMEPPCVGFYRSNRPPLGVSRVGRSECCAQGGQSRQSCHSAPPNCRSGRLHGTDFSNGSCSQITVSIIVAFVVHWPYICACRLVSAAWEARDYQTGRSTLVQLANALEDDASPHLSDQVNTWLALSSLYLHMGDGNAATRILLKVLSATEDVRAAVSKSAQRSVPTPDVAIRRKRSTLWQQR